MGVAKSIECIYLLHTEEYQYFIRKIKTFSKFVGNINRKPLNLIENKGAF